MGVTFSGRFRPQGTFSVRRGRVNAAPLWTTAAGTLGSVLERDTAAFALQATDPDGTLAGYAVTAGSLPEGLSLDPASGAITGRAALASGTALTSFTVRATDTEGATADREFGIEVIDTDPLLDQTVLLMPMDGTAGSTAFIDDSRWGKTVTAGGNATFSSAAGKFGTGVAAFDGTGDYISYADPAGDANFGAGDLTIEGWVYLNAMPPASTFRPFYHSRTSTTNYGGLHLGIWDNGRLAAWATSNNTSWNVLSQVNLIPSGITTGTWMHIAVTRQGAVWRGFLNGQLAATHTAAGTLAATDGVIGLGADIGGNSVNGSFQDYRVYRGVAKYTASFTPPAALLPVGLSDANWSKCILACPFTTTLRDYTPRRFTNTGNLALAAEAPGFGSSLYCDGTNYLDFGDSDDFHMAAGDYTFECWVKRSRTNTFEYPFGQANSSGTETTMLAFGFRNDGTVAWFDGAYQPFGFKVLDTNWHHVAFVRRSGTLRCFLDGVLDPTSYTVTTSTNNTTAFRIGRAGDLSSWPFQGHLAGLRITKAARYTGAFTPGEAVAEDDPDYASVVLHMPLDGTDGSTTFTDLKGHTVTRNAAPAAISTAQSRFGGASLSLGSSSYLAAAASADWVLPGDFTAEAWIYPTAAADGVVLARYNSSISNTGLYFIQRNSAGTVRFYVATGATANDFTSTITSPLNQWSHLALVRRGNTLLGFINGVLAGSVAVTVNMTTTGNQPLYIGAYIGSSGNLLSPFTGYIDDVRLTKGVARYTGGFVPGEAPVVPAVYDPDYANVSALLLMNGTNGSTTITDEKGKTVTRNGSVTISTTKAVFGQSAHFPNTNGGTQANYLSLGTSSDFVFGTGDFTIEYWVNHNSFASSWSGQQWHMGIWGGAGARELMILVTNSKLELYLKGVTALADSLTLVANTWYHVAVTRKSGTIRMYINGALRQSATNTSDLNVTTQAFAIGVNLDSASNVTSGGFDGYMDSVRLTKGVARYTGNAFRVPDRAFPTYE
jgi:hypothetical protein